MFYSLQGRVNLGLRLNTGKPGVSWFAGNVSDATLQLQSQSETKNESHSGQRLPAATIFTGQTGSFNATLDEWLTKNLAEAFYATPINTSSGSASAEVLPDELVVGDQVRLDKPYASSLVLTDTATPTPATVTSTKYKLVGHNDRLIEMLDVAGYTQPFNAAYTYEAFESLEAFSRAPRELYVMFDGIDTVNNDRVFIDMYRVRFSPVQNLALIQAGFGSLPLQGGLLYDELNADGSGTSGFFKMTRKAAA